MIGVKVPKSLIGFTGRWVRVKEKVDLSIIILNYNTRDFLRDCLESIKKSQKNGFSFEVIVVDNASTDGSREYLRNLERKRFRNIEKKKKSKSLNLYNREAISSFAYNREAISSFAYDSISLKLIFNNQNLGFAGGNNLGLRKAKGRYILFLNSDTVVKPESFKKMINFMEKNPQVGASTPKTMLFSGGMDPDCHRGFPTPWASTSYFLGLERLFPKSKIFGQYHKFYLDLNKAHEIDAGFGTFMFVREKALDKVGKWDENYFFYGEDLDLFYRIKEAGWKVMFYPEALVIHHKGASSGLRRESRKITRASRETRIKTARSSIKAMEIFYNKFYKNKYPLWMTRVVILGIKIKGFFRIAYHYLKG